MNYQTDRQRDDAEDDVVRELIRKPVRDERPEWVRRAEEKTLPAKELAR